MKRRVKVAKGARFSNPPPGVEREIFEGAVLDVPAETALRLAADGIAEILDGPEAPSVGPLPDRGEVEAAGKRLDDLDARLVDLRDRIGKTTERKTEVDRLLGNPQIDPAEIEALATEAAALDRSLGAFRGSYESTARAHAETSLAWARLELPHARKRLAEAEERLVATIAKSIDRFLALAQEVAKAGAVVVEVGGVARTSVSVEDSLLDPFRCVVAATESVCLRSLASERKGRK
jgi:hypothetical protein